MRLVKNAKEIAKRSHSMWANYLGIVCLIAPELIFWLWQIDTNPRFWFFLGLALIVYGIVGRLKDQNITRSPGILGLIAILAMSSWWSSPPVPTVNSDAPPSFSYTRSEFLAVAIPLIGEWEGLRLVAYKDIVGVWTVCFGETDGVRPGDSYSQAECEAMLSRRVVEYQAGLHDYFTADTVLSRLTVHRDAAFTSTAYNVGVSGMGKSTATRRLNATDIAGACEALTWWNRAGGRVVRGLVRRRAAEYDLCMLGVA